MDEYGRFRPKTNGALKIKNSKLEDSGQYTCRAINGFGNVEVNVSIRVLDPNEQVHHGKHPKASEADNAHPVEDELVKVVSVRKGKKAPFLLNTSPSNEFTRSTGQSIQFECNVGGAPRPTIKWFRNGEIVRSEDLPLGSSKHRGSLFIAKVQESLAGKYTCAAFNALGETSATFELRVRDPPGSLVPKVLESSLLNVTVTVGETATLHCKVISHSTSNVHIQWLKKTTDNT